MKRTGKGASRRSVKSSRTLVVLQSWTGSSRHFPQALPFWRVDEVEEDGRQSSHLTKDL